jgi:hypothetical protein
MTIATGVIAIDVLITGGAPIAFATQQRGAAVFDVPQRVPVAGKQTLAILLKIGRAVFPEDIR